MFAISLLQHTSIPPPTLIDQIMSSINQIDALELSKMFQVLRDNAYGRLEYAEC